MLRPKDCLHTSDGAPPAPPFIAVPNLAILHCNGTALPAELDGDPADRSPGELQRRGIRRLPQTLPEATGYLERSTVLREAMGDPLAEAFLAVRRAETELFSEASPEGIVAQTRWRW